KVCPTRRFPALAEVGDVGEVVCMLAESSGGGSSRADRTQWAFARDGYDRRPAVCATIRPSRSRYHTGSRPANVNRRARGERRKQLLRVLRVLCGAFWQRRSTVRTDKNVRPTASICLRSS